MSALVPELRAWSAFLDWAWWCLYCVFLICVACWGWRTRGAVQCGVRASDGRRAPGMDPDWVPNTTELWVLHGIRAMSRALLPLWLSVLWYTLLCDYERASGRGMIRIGPFASAWQPWICVVFSIFVIAAIGACRRLCRDLEGRAVDSGASFRLVGVSAGVLGVLLVVVCWNALALDASSGLAIPFVNVLAGVLVAFAVGCWRISRRVTTTRSSVRRGL